MKKNTFIPISALMGALLLALLVGVFSATPFGERNVVYAQTHDDNKLSSLSISGVSMSPAFNSNTFSYSARVGSTTTSVRVTATARNSKAEVAIDTNAAEIGKSTQTVTVTAGSSTEITVTVTPETGTAQEYMIDVYARNVSASQTSGSLLTSWALHPGEGTDEASVLTATVPLADINASENVRVAGNIEKVTLAVDAEDAGTVVRVGNIKYNDEVSHTIDLNGEGSKTIIRFTVTPEDGSSGVTHTITVYRERKSTSGDDKLTRLDLGSGIRLVPSFNANEADYTARVPYIVDDGKVVFTLSDNAGGVRHAVTSVVHGDDGEVTDTPTDITESKEFQLTAGRKNTITVKVAAEDVSTDDIADTAALSTTACTEDNIRCYNVVVYREGSPKSKNANLDAADATPAGLVVVDGTPDSDDPDSSLLGGDYDPDTTMYMNSAVGNGVERVTVTATPADMTGGASVDIDPADADTSSKDTHEVNLTAGQMTTITITVMAESGDTKTYTVKLYRKRSSNQLSDDDRLKSLTVTDASGAEQTLDPMFDSAETMYNVRVANGVSRVTIALEPFEYGARVAYSDGENVAITDEDGSVADYQIDSPDPGETKKIIVKVAAEDVSTDDIADTAALSTTACTEDNIRCYTINLYRQNAMLSDDAKLSVEDDAATPPVPAGIVVSQGSLDPDFAPDKTAYRLVVGNGVSSVTVTANAAHEGAMVDTMPDDEDSDASGHQVIAVVGEEKEITITVTAEDGTTMKTYKIMLYRERAPKSSDATLSALSFDNATLSPTFSPTTMTYTATARFTDSEFTKLAYAIDPGAKMVEVMSGRAGSLGDAMETRSGATVRLYNTGETVITIKVYAENSTGEGADATNTKTYTITVSRASEPSSDATLSSLSLKHLPMNKMEGESIDLSPMFDSGTMAYSADAGDEEMITVTAKAMHSAAMVSSVTVNGTAAMMTDIPTYWDMLGCPAMNDSVRMYDDHDHPDSPDSPYCTTYHMDATHPGLMGDAKAVVNMTFADYYDVPLMMGDNTISVMVTAEDGMTTEAYTVMVTRGDPGRTPGMTLLDTYDTNNNGMIELGEVVRAIVDYQDGRLSLADVVQVILMYHGS